MKLWWHKLKHWEYWPVSIVYTPAFFLWIWYAFKFRSFTFYKHANPGIKNGGLFGESKADIYKLLPARLYPKTVLIKAGEEIDSDRIVIENNLSFPVIVKPDYGHRGIGVRLISSAKELTDHIAAAGKDYLIQEFVDYPNEIGLFYVRMPNEKKGRITGITIKKFLIVEGNGRDTLEQLLKKVPRFEMQIEKLRNKFNLSEIMKHGQTRCLVPYGNHNRGTMFLDGRLHITEKLEKTFDELLSKIPEFFYGRLDIRFNNFEELEQGINFSIIELNGAKSEPTHIYDPEHSFWYGQNEIFKHQRMFMQIVKSNLIRS